MGKAGEHNRSRTENFSSVQLLHCKSLLCLCASETVTALTEKKISLCQKTLSASFIRGKFLWILKIEIYSTKILSYYKSEFQLMVFHSIINSLSASLQLNPTGFWKPSPTARGVEKLCGMLGREKPAEIFYPLVKGKIKDLVALKQANKFPASPNLKKYSLHPRQEGYL